MAPGAVEPVLSRRIDSNHVHLFPRNCFRQGNVECVGMLVDKEILGGGRRVALGDVFGRGFVGDLFFS